MEKFFHSFKVRGKSETIRISDECFEDYPAEVDETEMDKINDDMVKKLLMCDRRNMPKSDENKSEGPVVN